MKSMNDSNTDDDGNNHNNWLGFSLSPHMKMDVTSSGVSPHHHHHHYYHHPQASTATAACNNNNTVPTNFYMSPSHLNTSGICSYGVGENSAFHSPLAMMPLKSDGSLCIMEALTRSQTQVMVPTSSPKLEDFLGGATMGAEDYGSHHEREAMALSLDSIYYSNQNAHETETNGDHSSSLDLLSDPFRQQNHPYYSGLGIYQLEEEQTKEPPPQMPQVVEEESIANYFKNWVPQRDYSSTQHNLEQHQQQQQVNSSSSVLGGEDNNNGASSGNVGSVGCGELQSLSLSMSPGSQSSCVTVPTKISSSGTDSVPVDAKKRGSAKLGQKQPVHRKSIDTFGQRTSQYRGVTRHRWTGRYEAHLWDNSCKKEGQTRKGRQVYLGGYDMEEKAARAYDLAALKYWGPSTHINFPLENYQTQLEEMKNMSRQEYVAHLRRKSSGFSRGASMYRGVTRHHQHGRWQARIGRVAGNKDLYLGTFSTQEEAAEAYDVAAIKFRGVNAVTNFDITRYDVERIMASNTLLAGELARRNKNSEPRTTEAIEYNVVSSQQVEAVNNNNNININNNQNNSNNNNNESGSTDWKMGLYQHQQQLNNNCDQKTMKCGNYNNRGGGGAFSVSLQDLIGIDSVVGSSQQQGCMIGDESITKIGTHFSNPSSLVTSLSSSREASPDHKTGPTLLFPRPPMGGGGSSKIVTTSPTITSGSWFPSQMRPLSSHLPVFAAWSDI